MRHSYTELHENSTRLVAFTRPRTDRVTMQGLSLSLSLYLGRTSKMADVSLWLALQTCTLDACLFWLYVCCVQSVNSWMVGGRCNLDIFVGALFLYYRFFRSIFFFCKYFMTCIFRMLTTFMGNSFSQVNV